MRLYELIVLLHPDLEIDLEKPMAKIKKRIKEVNGTITKEDNWGKRRLAYTIKKQEFAVYVYMEVELEGDAVAKLDGRLNITDEVLRHLLVKHVEFPEEEKQDEDKNEEKE